MSLTALSDVDAVKRQLIDAARRRRALSYADLLFALGYEFSRPKMRMLCKTLDAIDTAAAARGEPELAVLVVRQADGLPGQGWWAGIHGLMRGYDGRWTGAEATAFVRELQEKAFAYWEAHPSTVAQDSER